MSDNKFERCADDDPNRCQTVAKGGQCPYKAVENETRCPRHIAAELRGRERKNVSQYRIQKYQSRLNEFAENDQIKSLREEVGIARMVLEEVINVCNGNPNQLLMMSNKISDLVMKIKALVESCHKLEKSTGSLLDKTAIVNIVGQLLNIVSSHIDDPDVMEEIANESLALITETSNDA